MTDVTFNLKVSCTYTPSARGARGQFGIQIEPDDQEELSIDTITDEDGAKIEIDGNFISNAEQHFLRVLRS